MFKVQIQFEWVQGQDAQSESVWTQEAVSDPEPFVAARHGFSHRVRGPQAIVRAEPDAPSVRAQTALGGRFVGYLLRSFSVLCALALLTAGAAPASQEQKALRLQRDLSATVAKDVQVWRAGDEAAYAALIDESADASWRRDLDRTWRRTVANHSEVPQVSVAQVTPYGEYALVATDLLEADSLWGLTRYRQYRFYRLEQGQWLRTFPNDSFWGERQVLETPHIRFEFREWDAPIIRETAVPLERIYTKLYRAVDLPPPLATDKLTLHVVPRSNSSWSVEERLIRVPSYVSVSADPSLSEADVFVQTVASGLTYQVLRDVRAPQGWAYSALWNTIFPGLHSWLMTTASDQPGRWDSQAEMLLRQRLAESGPLRLINLSYMPLPTERADEWLWRMKAGEMVIEYLSLTYGAEKLPLFIEGLSIHNSWVTLFPAVYDTSLQEFEAEWNAYLADKFPDVETSGTALQTSQP